MIIELKNIVNQTLRIAKPIPMGSRRQPVDGCFYASPVDVDLLLSGKNDEFKLTGSIFAKLICTSHRSLETYEEKVEEQIDILFVPRDSLDREGEFELEDQDMNVVTYVDTIDLCHVIDEQVALSLPMRLLSPQEREEPELHYSTSEKDRAKEDAEEEVVDDRLVVLKEIKEKMQKRNDG